MKIWLNIYYIAGALDSCGMGRIYTSLIKAFDHLGINYVLSNPDERCIEIWIGGAWQPSKLSGIDYGNILFGLTTGESDILTMPHYELFDHFFVNTEYYKSRQTTDKPVSIWHLGIDKDLFPFIKRTNNNFAFLHIGACQYRKGSHLACMAFDQEFGQDEDVRLIIRSSGETEFYYSLKQQFAHNKNIIFESGYVPITNLKDIYNADCLVFPSIREGWGLHLTEAMATGMPAIISDIPVLKEQFNANCGWEITTSNDFEYIGGNLPDLYDLRCKMRYVYTNQEECKLKGINAHKHIHNNFSWESGIITGLLPVLDVFSIKLNEIFK